MTGNNFKGSIIFPKKKTGLLQTQDLATYKPLDRISTTPDFLKKYLVTENMSLWNTNMAM